MAARPSRLRTPQDCGPPKTAGPPRLRAPQDCGPPKTAGKVHEARTLSYRASKFDCDACPLKPRCCPKAPARKIPRDIDEDVRDHLRALANTEAFETSRRKRKKVELAFAHLKPILKLDRLRLRGLSGARDEILLAATAQNLRKLAIYGARSPPGPRVHCIA